MSYMIDQRIILFSKNNSQLQCISYVLANMNRDCVGKVLSKYGILSLTFSVSGLKHRICGLIL